ncbi:hypothetical protein R0G64_31875, partial [Pseudomonas otitidis]|nr:hypothetical protein [Pseudomonas otitidis]
GTLVVGQGEGADVSVPGLGEAGAAFPEEVEVAAGQGHAKAMNFAGRFHEEGIGVPANPERAHAWYRRSAEA